MFFRNVHINLTDQAVVSIPPRLASFDIYEKIYTRNKVIDI